MTTKQFSNAEVAKYYDISEDHYAYFWNLNRSHSLHYGYWDTTTSSFHEALLKINEVMADKVGITSGTKVLDAGCGVGGSVAWLAKHRGAFVTGITLSEKQKNRANVMFASMKLEDKAHIQCADYLATPFESNTFDVVWAIESVCHASDKQLFLKEAYRLLKPGGKLILCDFFMVKQPDEKGQRAVDAWAHGWAVPYFESINNFNKLILSVGFTDVDLNDITHHIRKSARRLYYAFFPGWIFSKIYNLFHPNVTELSKKNVYTAYYQYTTLKAGWWKYYMVLAEKPL